MHTFLHIPFQSAFPRRAWERGHHLLLLSRLHGAADSSDICDACGLVGPGAGLAGSDGSDSEPVLIAAYEALDFEFACGDGGAADHLGEGGVLLHGSHLPTFRVAVRRLLRRGVSGTS